MCEEYLRCLSLGGRIFEVDREVGRQGEHTHLHVGGCRFFCPAPPSRGAGASPRPGSENFPLQGT